MELREEDRVYLCTHCHFNKVPFQRWKLGIEKKNPTYFTCMPCGEEAAQSVKHTIVPMPKSNYIVVTDHSLLLNLNSSHKGGR
jgi:hypothetical protein